MAAGAQSIKGLAIEPLLNARHGRISKSTAEKSEALAQRIIPNSRVMHSSSVSMTARPTTRP
jgi:hypothetical protein